MDAVCVASAGPVERESWSSTFDVIELNPIRYPFALDYSDLGCQNTWFPKEIALAEDVQQWRSVLTRTERHYVTWLLGFFSTAESLVANNLTMALYPHVPIPECRLYLGRQAYEEMNHTVTFDYVVRTLDLDRGLPDARGRAGDGRQGALRDRPDAGALRCALRRRGRASPPPRPVRGRVPVCRPLPVPARRLRYVRRSHPGSRAHLDAFAFDLASMAVPDDETLLPCVAGIREESADAGEHHAVVLEIGAPAPPPVSDSPQSA